MPPDQPVTWTAIAAIIASVGAIIGGLWAVYGAIKGQFEVTRAESESRAVRTHNRIEDLGKEVRDNFVHRDVFSAELRRVDDALAMRDRQHAELAARPAACPFVPHSGRAQE